MTDTMPGLAENRPPAPHPGQRQPRRRHWLRPCASPSSCRRPQVDETPLLDEDPSDLVLRLAELKAEIIAARNPGRWVMAADTTVAVDHHP
ncbi:MAG: Maf family protein [Holophagaceae bacterium]|uniref:Maf family protein n=1 Tax=Candidatus Geothrix odensensis TaxID=2954440 RepID=A0A936F321_9BACT|nr:Maf family protein [Candidatus Geothrix odensensis]